MGEKYQIKVSVHTANIFKLIFTLFIGVPDSIVIPLYSEKNVNTDLHWFTVTSILLHCNVYGKYL